MISITPVEVHWPKQYSANDARRYLVDALSDNGLECEHYVAGATDGDQSLALVRAWTLTEITTLGAVLASIFMISDIKLTFHSEAK